MLDNPPTVHTLMTLGQFGERARPAQARLNQAVLVIGLGYVGMQATVRIHRMLEHLITRRELQNNVRLLAIARRRSLRMEAALPREERLSLDMDGLPWSDVPGRYSAMGVPQWWPHSPRAPEMLNDPTQVRAYNRLMLYDNAALVGETLYKTVQWLHDVGTGRDLNIQRHIFVVGSLAEAEGSGMVFDITTRLRRLSGQRPVTISGVFALRAYANEHDPDDTLAMANVYASLREIDAFTLQPGMYPSPMPVIGYSLPSAPPRPALDAIYLTDDTLAAPPEAPESALADFVITWIAAQLNVYERPPELPRPIAHHPNVDRYSGYSTFGVSKIALPTRAAMDLAAVGLAQAALRAIKTTQTPVPTAQWVNSFGTRARDIVMDGQLLRAADVVERLRDWSTTLSATGLARQIESRMTRGETVTLLDVARGEWRRLEREMTLDTLAETSGVNAIPDSLCVRINDAMNANLVGLRTALLESPVDLAYNHGYGLLWTIGALEALDEQMQRLIPQLESGLAEARAAFQLAREEFLAIAGQIDSRAGGRYAGNRRLPWDELDERAHAALSAAANQVAAQTRLNAWLDLREIVDELATQVRNALPMIDDMTESLSDFEAACRQAMEEVANDAPEFPSAVVLNEDWFARGIQDIAGMRQLPPQQLLNQVFEAWSRIDTEPDHRLRRFIHSILDAARRALAGMFTFMDLREFLEAYGDDIRYQRTLAQLPHASTPAMLPIVDEHHPPPARYEIVCEMPREAGSTLGPPQQGVIRAHVAIPDPDQVTVMRIIHGMMAEALPALREGYRRAYDRAGAEGMPLHIDRRWDATMADLVHTTARREISIIWEDLLEALNRDPDDVEEPMEALIHAFEVALDVEEKMLYPGGTPPDMHLVVYKLRPFRLKLPPPHCAVMFLHSNRAANEVGKEMLSAITPLPLEEQFAFVVDITGRADIDEVIAPLEHVDFTILTLGEADVKHLIGARMPHRALSDFVLNQVNLTTVSPFYTRGPVPEHMFFGREREINEVRSKLRTHSVALIGGRRIGKTSTLQRIQRLLEPDESDYIPYYLDCHGATTYQSFFWLISRRWGVDIDQNANPVQFEEVVERLQMRHPGKALAILFDEVDSLMNFDRRPENQETLFRTFRSLSNEKRCQYVFSGEKWLMSSISDPYSALFNFTQAVRLEPLPPRVVHRLVAEPFEMLNIWIEGSDQVINRIYQISAGHPNIVQMICQGMVEEMDEEGQNMSLLNIEHLDRATSQRDLQEQIVQTIWGQMNPLAKLITLIWPEGVRFLTLNEIEEQLKEIKLPSVPPELLERTAKDLELYCFVRPREHDRLELIPMAFPAILDFMTDKARQIEIIRRQYKNQGR